jgi:hypothetical protein
MNGKRGRCALCTINKKEIKIMKQFKKLASLLLAAVLAMTLLAGCGGRGGNVSIAVTEQNLLKYINEARAEVDKGLSPVKNDPSLANAAAKLLEAYSEAEMVKTYYGTGYELSRDQAKNILKNATGKNQEFVASNEAPGEYEHFFYVAPIEGKNSARGELYLSRRANKVVDYGYGAAFSDFAGNSVVLASDMKVGIAFREIKGERFALVVYDVTNPEKTAAS